MPCLNGNKGDKGEPVNIQTPTLEQMKKSIIQNTVNTVQTEGKATRQAMESMRINNNQRQAYFMIGTIKAISPTSQINEKAIKTIVASFNKHGLGKLDEKYLHHYYRGTTFDNRSDNEDETINYRPNKNKND